MVELDNNLRDYYNVYFNEATRIPNWESLTKTQLANKYCEENDKRNIKVRDGYFASLVCKYFYLAPLIYNKNKSIFHSVEDALSVVAEGILKGLNSKKWLEVGYKLYGNERGAEIYINKCITNLVAGMYYESNQNNQKANYSCTCVEDMSSLNCDSNYVEEPSTCDDVIRYYIKKSDIIKAIVVDLICYDDSFYKNELNNRKLMLRMNEIYKDRTYFNYFAKRYLVKESSVERAFKNITKDYCERYIKEGLLKKVVKDTIDELKSSPTIRGMVC